MAVTLVFLLGVAAIAGWWLAQQRLTSKPWLESGNTGGMPLDAPHADTTVKVGLGVFLTVVGALFALFLSAYAMRMALSDWESVAPPRLLWLNTAVLVLASAALHRAPSAARRGQTGALRPSLYAAGAATVAFLAGQVVAWQLLAGAGHPLTSGPAAAFFYLLTAVHGLHIVGGLAALGRIAVRMGRGAGPGELRLGIELCALYWHFLLVVWLVLFGLLALT